MNQRVLLAILSTGSLLIAIVLYWGLPSYLIACALFGPTVGVMSWPALLVTLDLNVVVALWIEANAQPPLRSYEFRELCPEVGPIALRHQEL